MTLCAAILTAVSSAQAQNTNGGANAAKGSVMAVEANRKMQKTPARFVHPCIPNTIKTNLNQEPWKQGYAMLADESRSQLNYTMQGPFANVSRRVRYDRNLRTWRQDMTAVYNLARMWYFTGNTAYAQKSHDILLAWATTHTSFTGNESGLDLGDYAAAYGGGPASCAVPGPNGRLLI